MNTSIQSRDSISGKKIPSDVGKTMLIAAKRLALRRMK